MGVDVLVYLYEHWELLYYIWYVVYTVHYGSVNMESQSLIEVIEMLRKEHFLDPLRHLLPLKKQ